MYCLSSFPSLSLTYMFPRALQCYQLTVAPRNTPFFKAFLFKFRAYKVKQLLDLPLISTFMPVHYPLCCVAVQINQIRKKIWLTFNPVWIILQQMCNHSFRTTRHTDRRQ